MSPRFVDGIGTEGETTPCSTNGSGEKALVIAAKNGNERAFETLVKRYRGRIIAIALRFTRVEEDAEDAAQLSFQKAYFRLHTFEGKSSFSTWLTRIAINEALMLRRRARKSGRYRLMNILSKQKRAQPAWRFRILALTRKLAARNTSGREFCWQR